MSDENDENIVPDIDFEEENTAEALKKLREKLKKCELEKMDYLSGWQRAKADFINAQREEGERLQKGRKFAEENVIQELLSLADGFERAMSGADWDNLDKNWQDGFKYLYNQLEKILKERKVESIKSVGEVFNPQLHEILGEREVEDEKSDHTVLEEARKGYAMHGKVIRASQVIVGKFNKK